MVALPGSFPAPTEVDLTATADALHGVPDDCVLLVDGLAFGVLPAELVSQVPVPVVALVHHPLALETGLDAATAAKLADLERAALALSDGVVVTSPMTRDTLVQGFGVAGSKITVAVPGLGSQWRAVERAPVDPPTVLAVGSLIPRKGYDVLLQALERLTDLEWRAVVIGSPDRAPATAAKVNAAAAALGDRVQLVGEASGDAVLKTAGEATLFALATRYEGYGMVFLEAMAAGLPVVATRGGAAADVIAADAGLLADVDDVEGVAAAIRAILTDEALADRLSAGARRAGEAAQGWDDTARQVSERLTAARETRVGWA
ncbi:MAG: glycosyltransferase family 4 protein [Pseudomonadota bacterium]